MHQCFGTFTLSSKYSVQKSWLYVCKWIVYEIFLYNSRKKVSLLQNKNKKPWKNFYRKQQKSYPWHFRVSHSESTFIDNEMKDRKELQASLWQVRTRVVLIRAWETKMRKSHDVDVIYFWSRQKHWGLCGHIITFYIMMYYYLITVSVCKLFYKFENGPCKDNLQW